MRERRRQETPDERRIRKEKRRIEKERRLNHESNIFSNEPFFPRAEQDRGPKQTDHSDQHGRPNLDPPPIVEEDSDEDFGDLPTPVFAE